MKAFFWLLAVVLITQVVGGQPMVSSMEPTTDEKSAVLLEIFGALFVPTRSYTRSFTTHVIRGHINDRFGYLSNNGVDHILGRLGCLENMGTVIRHKCRVPIQWVNAIRRAESLEEWVGAIEQETGRDMPLTRLFILSHGNKKE